MFKHGTLEVLHGVGLTVCIASFLHLLRDGEALLRQASVALPIGQELSPDGLTCLLKCALLLLCCTLNRAGRKKCHGKRGYQYDKAYRGRKGVEHYGVSFALFFCRGVPLLRFY